MMSKNIYIYKVYLHIYIHIIAVVVQEGRTNSVAMDYDHDPKTMYLLSDQGFLSALYHATCVRPGGGALAAPVCSSFVYMPLRLHKKNGFQLSPNYSSWFVNFIPVETNPIPL